MWTLGGPRLWFKLQCVSLLLAYFTADSRLFFIIVYNQPRNFSVHSLNVFLFTRLPEWASVRFQMNYSLTVSHQIVQHIFQNWPRYLLCFWCGVLHLKIVEDCIFLCILQYFHWPSDACYILLLVEWMYLQVPRRFSDSYKCGAQPRKHGTRTWTFVYVPPFSFAYQYPFNCANVF